MEGHTIRRNQYMEEVHKLFQKLADDKSLRQEDKVHVCTQTSILLLGSMKKVSEELLTSVMAIVDPVNHLERALNPSDDGPKGLQLRH